MLVLYLAGDEMPCKLDVFMAEKLF